MLVGLAGFFLRQLLTPTDIVSSLNSGQYQKAAELMQVPAHKDNTVVLTALANLYYLGLGVEQNFEQSARLYSMAAFGGNLAAQVNLGHLYNQGFGLEQDTRLAYAWFNLANNNGSVIAQDYMTELLAEHKLTFHFIQSLRTDYVTVENFPRLH